MDAKTVQDLDALPDGLMLWDQLDGATARRLSRESSTGRDGRPVAKLLIGYVFPGMLCNSSIVWTVRVAGVCLHGSLFVISWFTLRNIVTVEILVPIPVPDRRVSSLFFLCCAIPVHRGAIPVRRCHGASLRS